MIYFPWLERSMTLKCIDKKFYIYVCIMYIYITKVKSLYVIQHSFSSVALDVILWMNKNMTQSQI